MITSQIWIEYLDKLINFTILDENSEIIYKNLKNNYSLDYNKETIM